MDHLLHNSWPGREDREPSLGDRSYLILSHLSRLLDFEVKQQAERLGGKLGTVLDVGAGVSPYYPLVAGLCEHYLSFDPSSAGAQVRAAAESLPVRDGSADLILCTQVLEHVEDPAATVRECSRSLRPGGLALVSTHGTYAYHPGPADYWRWTGPGLSKLFRDNGSFKEVRVLPCGGTFTCLCFLMVLYVWLLADRARSRFGWIGRLVAMLFTPLIVLLNLTGRFLDSAFPRLSDPNRAYTLTANFLVVAER